MSPATDQTTATAKRAAKTDKVAVLARLGYAARGLVYIVVGGLALATAIGSGGEQTGSKGALSRILEAPFGKALLIVVVIGLLGFVVWRVVQSLADADHYGKGVKGILARTGFLVSGIVYLLLAIYAVSLLWTGGGSGGRGGGGKQAIVEQVMNWPGGRWVVIVVGAIVIATGLYQFHEGHAEKYKKYLAMGAKKMKWASPMCKFGLMARGAAFVIIGGFVVVAGAMHRSQQVGGFSQVFQFLQGQVFGNILLVVIAAGLIAFGLYQGLMAIFRRLAGAEAQAKQGAEQVAAKATPG